MTQVQIESTGTERRTATVKLGVSGAPYIEVQNNGVDLVPLEYSHSKVIYLLAAGYMVSDPQHLITCHCGTPMIYGQDECGACRREAQDAKDDGQMYSDLIGGM